MENDYVVPVVISSIVFFSFGIFAAVLILHAQRKRLQDSQEATKMKVALEYEMYKSQTEVQNQTMQGIAGELHDNIGQLLTVVKMQLHLVEDLPVRDEVKNAISEITEIISKTINEVRHLTMILDNNLGKNFGLVKSIKNELMQMGKTGGCSTELIVANNLPALGFQKELILFRVTQEALNNAVSYALADRLRVSTRVINDQFQLVIENNGVDFDQNSLNNSSIQTFRAGLRDMKYRIEILGGTFKIISGDELGFRTEIRIPL